MHTTSVSLSLKFHFTCRESSAVALSHYTGILFAVNRYECFMECKSTIKGTFCGYKPSKKDIYPHQNFTDSYKKCVEALDELQDTQNIKR